MEYEAIMDDPTQKVWFTRNLDLGNCKWKANQKYNYYTDTGIFDGKERVYITLELERDDFVVFRGVWDIFKARINKTKSVGKIKIKHEKIKWRLDYDKGC